MTAGRYIRRKINEGAAIQITRLYWMELRRLTAGFPNEMPANPGLMWGFHRSAWNFALGERRGVGDPELLASLKVRLLEESLDHFGISRAAYDEVEERMLNFRQQTD